MYHFVVFIPYREAGYAERHVHKARIDVLAPSEDDAKKAALEEFQRLEGLSCAPVPRDVLHTHIEVRVISPAGSTKSDLDVSGEVVSEKVCVLELVGVLDENTTEAFKEKVDALREEGVEGFVFDCSGLEYLNSSGIGMLLEESSSCTLVLCNVREDILKLLQLVGADQVVGIRRDRTEALESLSALL